MKVEERTFRILAIEDNPGDVHLIREALNGRSVRIEVALDGNTGAAMLATGSRPDLVIMDINLPGLDGLQVLQRIRANPELKQLPVVMFTSSNMVEDVHAAERHGADMFLVKPFDVSEYLTMLRRIVDRFLPEEEQA